MVAITSDVPVAARGTIPAHRARSGGAVRAVDEVERGSRRGRADSASFPHRLSGRNDRTTGRDARGATIRPAKAKTRRARSVGNGSAWPLPGVSNRTRSRCCGSMRRRNPHRHVAGVRLWRRRGHLGRDRGAGSACRAYRRAGGLDGKRPRRDPRRSSTRRRRRGCQWGEPTRRVQRWRPPTW